MKKLFVSALLLVSVGFVFQLCAADVHTVVSEKPYILTDGENGSTYYHLEGYCTINWKDKTRYGSYFAKIFVHDSPIRLVYEFTCISISNSNDDFIEGLWDIRRNGVLVASGIVGKLYGLNQPVGSYFKFYGGDTQCNTNTWHMSAFVVDRFDY